MISKSILFGVTLLALVARLVQGETTTDVPETPSLEISPQDAELILGDSYNLTLTLRGEVPECINVTFDLGQKQLCEDIEAIFVCPDNETLSWQVTINTNKVGKTTLRVHVFPDVLDTKEALCRLSVIVDPAINVVADVLGWIYTIAWDISFLPQIIHNWRRKSVIGLSFDFLTFNFLGFFSYFIFNMGLLWIDEIQAEYMERNPDAVLHVRVNDVIFPLYALVCTAFQIAQCFFYEKEAGQRVSITCRVITGLLILSAVVCSIIVPLVDSIWWLDLFYWFSYIKLIITTIKYAPQLWENFQRKSTEGWSIYQVILDFTGGTFSLVQMFLLAHNYDDWMSVLKDPSKLGLGLLSIFFNIFFFIQHYGLYRNSSKKETNLFSSTDKIPELNGSDNAAYNYKTSDVTTHM